MVNHGATSQGRPTLPSLSGLGALWCGGLLDVVVGDATWQIEVAVVDVDNGYNLNVWRQVDPSADDAIVNDDGRAWLPAGEAQVLEWFDAREWIVAQMARMAFSASRISADRAARTPADPWRVGADDEERLGAGGRQQVVYGTPPDGPTVCEPGFRAAEGAPGCWRCIGVGHDGMPRWLRWLRPDPRSPAAALPILTAAEVESLRCGRFVGGAASWIKARREETGESLAVACRSLAAVVDAAARAPGADCAQRGG